MVHRHLWAALGGSLAVLGLFALVAAASWDFSKAGSLRPRRCRFMGFLQGQGEDERADPKKRHLTDRSLLCRPR